MPSSPAGIKARACSQLHQVGDLGLPGASPSQTSYGVLGSLGWTTPQSGEPSSAFCTCSFLWVPSQYGGFWVALKVQRATMQVSWALNFSGERLVCLKKCEPSQKGCFLLWPHTHTTCRFSQPPTPPWWVFLGPPQTWLGFWGTIGPARRWCPHLCFSVRPLAAGATRCWAQSPWHPHWRQRATLGLPSSLFLIMSLSYLWVGVCVSACARVCVSAFKTKQYIVGLNRSWSIYSSSFIS